MAKRIDPRVDIGHVHLKVADLDRAIAFYQGVLGFEVTQRMPGAAFLSAGGYHHHIGLNTWDSDRGAPASGTTGLYHLAIRYPTRAALGDALRRLVEHRISLDGASDHGVSEALYLRDPDGNGVELYWDRPRDVWPRAADGTLDMITAPLDLRSLRAAAEEAVESASDSAPSGLRRDRPSEPGLSEAMRTRLRELRARLLNLHKVLLDDARVAYELDRGRIASAASLLQLVINDPWFAWLHPLSELVVRIDETIEPDSPASEADGAALVEQVERLLAPAETGEPFARRYFEALQRQPSVVLAHADVRRVLKSLK
jgi:catechol 2,3-dioxygenase